jgi:hypothetical protein
VLVAPGEKSLERAALRQQLAAALDREEELIAFAVLRGCPRGYEKEVILTGLVKPASRGDESRAARYFTKPPLRTPS